MESEEMYNKLMQQMTNMQEQMTGMQQEITWC